MLLVKPYPPASSNSSAKRIKFESTFHELFTGNEIPIGISTIDWGDPSRNFVASGKLTKRMIKAGKFVPGDCQMVYNKLMEGGISFIETSSAYGKASRKQSLGAHEILAQCVAEYQADGSAPSVIESLPFGWIPRLPGTMKATVEKSCERLTIDTVDVVQVPKRIPLLSKLLANGLYQIQEAGSSNYVGVSGIVQKDASVSSNSYPVNTFVIEGFEVEASELMIED